MPLDTQRLIQNKDLIISTIQSRGPCLPVHVANSIHLSILFTSAFLSELYGEKRVLMSHMKVGSSSLYYLQGQEAQLENFIQYLNPKEKEAFHLLKKEKLIKDEHQEPAIRVALRELKDFAQPVKISIDNEPKTFWKYFLLSNQEAEELAQQFLAPKKKQPLENPPQEIPSASTLPEEPKEKALKKQREQRSLPTAPSKEITLPLPFAEKASLPQEPLPLSPFAQQVQAHLIKKGITLHQIIADKKKEVVAKVSIDTSFGPQSFYLIAKDKKRMKEEDLIDALQKAHTEKMPALLIAPGEVEKKALSLLKEWNNLIKFEKIT